MSTAGILLERANALASGEGSRDAGRRESFNRLLAEYRDGMTPRLHVSIDRLRQMHEKKSVVKLALYAVERYLSEDVVPPKYRVDIKPHVSRRTVAFCKEWHRATHSISLEAMERIKQQHKKDLHATDDALLTAKRQVAADAAAAAAEVVLAHSSPPPPDSGAAAAGHPTGGGASAPTREDVDRLDEALATVERLWLQDKQRSVDERLEVDRREYGSAESRGLALFLEPSTINEQLRTFNEQRTGGTFRDLEEAMEKLRT